CIGEGGDDRINIILTGGVAVHVYVNSRVSRDVDVLFDRPVSVPPGLSAVYSAPEGDMVVGMDQGMVRLVSLLHPDYGEDALFGWSVGRLNVHVLAPVDLAVSKIGRWADRDIDDVRDLAAAGLLEADAVEERVMEALKYYVGNERLLRYNVRDALELIKATRQVARP